MTNPPPLPPELEALLAPHRTVLPIAPSVAARALARAAAVRDVSWEDERRVFGRPRWVFAAAAGAVLVLGAAAYAGRAWLEPLPAGTTRAVPIESPRAGQPSARSVVPATPNSEAPTMIVSPAAPRARRNAGNAGRMTAAAVRPTNAELQLLLVARQDVTDGDFTGALAVVAEHARRFRNGSLVEEREALRIKALAGLGRHQEAQRAAAAFHTRFPHSVFFSTFERMKETER